MLFLDSRNARRFTTAPAMVDYAKNKPATIDLMRAGRRCRKSPVKEGLTLVSYAVISERYHQAAADEFFQSLADGAGLAAGSPILALRNRLINIRTDRIRLSNQTLLGYIVTAFNAWTSGRSLQKIQRPREGMWTQETFPSILPATVGVTTW